MKTGIASRRRRAVPMMTLAVLSVGLMAGCGEADVTLHEPGVYKGSNDPLLARESDPEYQRELDERFRQVQWDR